MRRLTMKKNASKTTVIDKIVISDMTMNQSSISLDTTESVSRKAKMWGWIKDVAQLKKKDSSSSLTSIHLEFYIITKGSCQSRDVTAALVIHRNPTKKPDLEPTIIKKRIIPKVSSRVSSLSHLHISSTCANIGIDMSALLKNIEDNPDDSTKTLLTLHPLNRNAGSTIEPIDSFTDLYSKKRDQSHVKSRQKSKQPSQISRVSKKSGISVLSSFSRLFGYDGIDKIREKPVKEKPSKWTVHDASLYDLKENSEDQILLEMSCSSI